MSALLLTLAVPAVASAAPVNDKFANRQVLPAGFPTGPVEVTGSNVNAGDEEGESLPGLSPAGHSVWFGWEATGAGWVTVGTCDSEFPTLVGVFTGTEVEDLTLVASGSGNEGPDCPFEGRQYTFFAIAGTEYVIAVDGNSFSPSTVTEGNFVLQIKETPVPPNDEFENATVLNGEISEEPGGARRYMANTQGFNWNAENEHGEPEELTSGASVWYAWTAPEDGIYSFADPGGLDLDLYTGGAIDELEEVLVGQDFGKVDLTAGQALRLRVSGPIDPDAGAPLMQFFNLIVSAELPPLPTPSSEADPAPIPPPPSSPDTKAPQTTVKKTVLKRQPPIFVFKFSSDEQGSSFRCGLDGGKFKPCGSGKRFAHQASGPHKLRVVAVDPAGNVDPTPAVGRFRFPPPQR
jgi:hypothetical protein